MEANEKETPMVAPDGPWQQRWEGSGPQRGDHIFGADGERIAYLGDQHHDGVSAVVYAHNCDMKRRQTVATDTEVREFLGWLAADIRELGAVEVPRLAESWVRFLAREC